MMTSKYAIQKLNGGWVVVMTANGQIVSECVSTEEAAKIACHQFECGERVLDKKNEVWVIGGVFVMEPYLGGMLIGEVEKLDMNQYVIVKRMTQAALDKSMMKHYEKHGDFPGI